MLVLRTILTCVIALGSVSSNASADRSRGCLPIEVTAPNPDSEGENPIWGYTNPVEPAGIADGTVRGEPTESQDRATGASGRRGIPVHPGKPVRGIRRFAVSKIVDLTFVVEVSEDLRSDELLILRVFTPKGHLYQEYVVPIAEEPVAGGSRRVAGYPRPLKVYPIKEAVEAGGKRSPRQRKVVEYPFPVAGTLIVSNGLYGKWRLRAALDDADYRVCGPAYFYLQDR